MSEYPVFQPTAFESSGGQPQWVSRDLSARAANLALQLGELLEATCTPESGAHAAVAFLREWADSAGDAWMADYRPTPLDAVVDRFDLTADERDLLLLAGLPEEHEGLANTFRSLHPRSEPRPTVGLAALLLAKTDGARSALRRLLADGALVRHRLVHLAGDTTFHEHTLVPAEKLWDALHGNDAWPASLERVAIGDPPPGLDGWLELPAVVRAVHALRASDDRTLLLPAADEAVGVSRCAALAVASGRPPVGGRLSAADHDATALLVAHAAARSAVPVLFLPARGDDAPAVPPALGLDGILGPVLACAPPGSVRPAGLRPVLTVPFGPDPSR